MKSFERMDYANLAKEFECAFRIGKYGIKFFSRDPSGRIHRIIKIIPLDGWISDPDEVVRIIRENGLEL